MKNKKSHPIKILKGKYSMKNLVSIVVPIYNAEKYLHECICSILNQTYKNLEILLIDDGNG